MVKLNAGGRGDAEVGWSGTGARGKFRNVILPSALKSALPPDSHPEIKYKGSYSRHTTTCVSDIDMHVSTKPAVSRADRVNVAK